jgi:DNA-binding CsgD family transcriptional regulator
LASPHAGFVHHTEPGGYERLISSLEDHWEAFESLSGGWGAGGLALMRSERLLETGRPSAALDMAERAQAEADCHGQGDIVLAASLVTMRAALALKRPETALRTLKTLPSAPPGQEGRYRPAEAVRGYVAMNLGRLEDLEDWGRVRPLSSIPPWTRHGAFFSLIVHARALAARREWDALPGLSERLGAVFKARRSVLGMVHALTLEAIARWSRDGVEASLAVFRKAVDLAAPDHLVTIPAEPGRLVIPLLARAREDPSLARHHDYLDEVMALARVFDSLAETAEPEERAPRRLTARERDFLDHVVLGRSNQQIAELYKVKKVTVTKALSNAYRKLGAKNRSQAVHHLMSGRSSGP